MISKTINPVLIDRVRAFNPCASGLAFLTEAPDVETALVTATFDDVVWLAQKINPARCDETRAPALKVYDETRASALKVYDETRASALKVYEETCASAWKVYDETRRVCAIGIIRTWLVESGVDE